MDMFSQLPQDPYFIMAPIVSLLEWFIPIRTNKDIKGHWEGDAPGNKT